MKVKDLIDENLFTILLEGDNLETEITKPFCCDLLSIVMGKALAGYIWITVMGNINTVAVASLADVSCIVLAEGSIFDDVALNKAKLEGITVLKTKDSVFDAALKVHQLIEKG